MSSLPVPLRTNAGAKVREACWDGGLDNVSFPSWRGCMPLCGLPLARAVKPKKKLKKLKRVKI